MSDVLAAYYGSEGFPPGNEPGPNAPSFGNVLSSLTGIPPWLEAAQKQAGADVAAYQRGGVPELLKDTGNTAELASGFNPANIGIAGIFGGKIGAGRLAAAGKPQALEALPRAEAMHAAGAAPEEIHAATGWAPDAAGKLSFEIPDYGTGFRPMAPLPEGTGVEGQLSPFIGGPIGKPGREMLAEHAYNHPDLFTAYPELARYAMKFEDPVKREGFLFKGGADPVNKDFYLNPEAFSGPEGREAMRSTMLHEFQHPVQAIENFPSGGSPGMPEVRQAADQAIARRSEAINQKIQDLYAQRDAYVRSAQETAQDPGRDVSTSVLAKEFWDANPEAVKEAARLHAQQAINEHGNTRNSEVIKQYKSVAGEVQARNVQARADIPPEDLKHHPPSWTQDTPNEEQLIRFSDATGYDTTPADVVRGLTLDTERTGPITGVGRPYISEANRPLFDYSRLSDVPNVPQFNLPRVNPPEGVPESATKVATPSNIARVNKAVQTGESMGGREWYNTEPLRESFVSELGDAKGNAAFRQYMEMVAANSPRTRVPENIRNASYFYGTEQRGEPLPRTYLEGGYHRMVKSTQAPSPYGVMPIHVQNMENLRQGGLPVLQNPKPASFVENLTGNQTPVTIDTHNMRLLTRARDAEVPKANEYGFLENLQQEQAAKMGMSPAQYQASAWLGAGKETGLASPVEPFLRTLESRIEKTAEVRGLTKAEVLRQFIRGQAPLLSLAAVLAGQGQPAQEQAQ